MTKIEELEKRVQALEEQVVDLQHGDPLVDVRRVELTDHLTSLNGALNLGIGESADFSLVERLASSLSRR